MGAEQKLEELGLTLPEVPKPVAAYVPGARSGNIIYTSGQIPFENGVLVYKGRLGEDLVLEDGYKAARLCCLNCLGIIKSMVGNLNKVKKIIKINGFVNSSPDFTDQPKVINGASDLCLDVFGEKGKHARAAVGTSGLPLGAAVEVEIIVEVED